MTLRFSHRAADDLEAICDYICERNPGAALRVRNSLQASLQIIALHPKIGRLQTGGVRRYATPRLPYLIFYRVDVAAGALEVVTIRHGARDPDDTGV